MLNRKIVSASTKILGIIGYPISHTMSPIMHNLALDDLNLDYVYVKFEVVPKNLKNAILGMKALNIYGVNATIPYKESVMQYMDIIDPLAKKIGAVNTIKIQDGLFIAKNTDAEGARQALLDADIDLSGLDVVILGSGGAAKAVSYAIVNSINRLTIINRTKQNAIKLANRLKRHSSSRVAVKKTNKSNLKEEIKKADLLINATPIGMLQFHHSSIISRDMLHKDLVVFDLIYNPLETQLLKDAKLTGCKTLNGLDMLINQGALAFEWWTSITPNTNLMKRKIIKILNENEEK
ncbi:MAG: shikimate dehydrogenase [Promethearchaeota archaeon]|nr:MAG: shikimate dehydrogenase [Candidatus Lokiarchaeota archaeon]